MKLSKWRIQADEKLAEQAKELYKQGLSLRKVAQEIGRSYQWVWMRVKDLE